MATFYRLNDNTLEVQGLKNTETDTYFTTAATVTGQLRDSADVNVGSAVTFSFVTGSNGNFVGTFDKTSQAVPSDETGSVLLTASEDGAEATIEYPLTFADRLEPATVTAESIDVVAEVNRPLMMRTEEGTVRERNIEEIIAADRYNKSNAATEVPYGMRVARIKPGGTTHTSDT